MARKLKSRRPLRSSLRLLAGVAAAYIGAIALLSLWLGRSRNVVLSADKDAYFHYEFVRVRLETKDLRAQALLRASPPEVWVVSEGRTVPTIGGRAAVPLTEDAPGTWSALWPVPWNAPEGSYRLQAEVPADLRSRLYRGEFRIQRRSPKPLPPGFAAVTFEDLRPLKGLKVTAPDGTRKDWKGLFDWARFIGADAVWVLAGETPGPGGKVWVDYNFPQLPKMAAEAHRRGFKFGVWVMCYLTMPGAAHHPRYEYALKLEDGRLATTRSLSLRDPNRPGDIAALLKRLRDIPGVDFLGLDYIRNAAGGYELAEDFYREMPFVAPPAGWAGQTAAERQLAFARLVNSAGDHRLVESWRWWRAHKVAEIVKGVRREVGDEPYLWAFTLGWQKGWEHGQDPMMMTDAGIDVDAVMLYEADAEQFDNLLHDWHAYLRRDEAQVIPGDCLDDPLHQGRGPAGFESRLSRAVDGIYADARPPGIFIHDLSRGLWGRKGPHTTEEWMSAARSAIQDFRRRQASGPQETAGRVLASPAFAAEVRP